MYFRDNILMVVGYAYGMRESMPADIQEAIGQIKRHLDIQITTPSHEHTKSLTGIDIETTPSVEKPPRKKREFTEEQRQAMRERMLAARAQRGKASSEKWKAPLKKGEILFDDPFATSEDDAEDEYEEDDLGFPILNGKVKDISPADGHKPGKLEPR